MATVTVRFNDASASPPFMADEFRVVADHLRFWAARPAGVQEEVQAFALEDVDVVMVVGNWTGQGQESLPAGITLQVVPDTAS